MIPGAAVEASKAAIWDLAGKPVGFEWQRDIQFRAALEAATEFEWQRDMIARAALEAAAPHLMAEATELVAALTDPEDCSFDHHGGCQSHGYLDLKPGEMCPQLEAKAWAHNHRSQA